METTSTLFHRLRSRKSGQVLLKQEQTAPASGAKSAVPGILPDPISVKRGKPAKILYHLRNNVP